MRSSERMLCDWDEEAAAWVWTGRNDPHLTPCLVDFVSQPHNLVKLRNIGGDNQDVGLADLTCEQFPELVQLFLVNIRNGNFETQP